MKGYTQEYMAKKLGMSQKVYSNLENSGKEPGKEQLAKIAAALQVTPEYIAEFAPPSIVVNNFNGEFSGNNNYNIQTMIVNSEEKILAQIKEIFQELKSKVSKKQ